MFQLIIHLEALAWSRKMNVCCKQIHLILDNIVILCVLMQNKMITKFRKIIIVMNLLMIKIFLTKKKTNKIIILDYFWMHRRWLAKIQTANLNNLNKDSLIIHLTSNNPYQLRNWKPTNQHNLEEKIQKNEHLMNFNATIQM